MTLTTEELAEMQIKIQISHAELKAVVKEIKAINEQSRLAKKDASQVSLFKGMYTVLKPTYDKFCTIISELTELHIRINKPDEFPAAADSTLISSARRYFYESTSTYLELNSGEQVPGPSQNLTSAVHESRFHRTHLPRISLPQFNGNLSNWPRFRDTYQSLVHSDANVSSIEKFHFLLSSLSGEALALLSKFEITEDNYNRAWTCLLDNYDKARVLATMYLNKLIEYKSVYSKSTIASLQSFITNVAENIEAFKRLSIPDKSDYMLAHLALRALDPVTRQQFEITHTEVEFPTVDSVITYVRQRCLGLKLASDSQQFTPSKATNNSNSPSRPTRSSVANYKVSLVANKSKYNSKTNRSTTPAKREYVTPIPTKCFVCGNEHSVSSCPTVLKATPTERQALFTNWKGCRNCFKQSHDTQSCMSKWSCRICRQRHHTLLHVFNEEPTDGAVTPLNAGPSNPAHSAVHTACALNHSDTKEIEDVLLGTARALIKDVSGRYHEVRLLLDSGSHYSFITSECIKRLGLPILPFKQKISGLGQNALESIQGIAECFLRAEDDRHSELSTKAVVVPNITGFLPRVRIPLEVRNNYLQYQLADPNFWKPGSIDVLLGSDLFTQVITAGPVALSPKLPHLLPSIFGCIVMGKFNNSELTSDSGSSTVCFTRNEDPLNDLLHKFWELEEPVIAKPTHPDEDYCEQHFQSTHYRTDNGRYVVSLPFRETDVELADSYSAASRRLSNLEKKLQRNPDLLEGYKAFLQEYLSLNHMHIATRPGKYVIPHHCVLKPSSASTKIRVVFDASSKTATGSLNDKLLPGPKLHKDIGNVLLNFRLFPVVFVADIVKMYRQILVHPDHQVFQHILWRFDLLGPIQEYELSTVTYGLNCSPYLALRVLKQLAIDEGSNYPLAAEKLINDMYVDDLVSGTYNLEEARLVIAELVKLLKCGGFELSKWVTNKMELSSEIETTNEPLSIGAEQDAKVKVLGLQWDPQADIFSYSLELPDVKLTKRNLLSCIARIYDPLGYLAPIVFLAKELMQRLWKLKLGWDDVVPDDIRQRWYCFIKGLKSLSNLQIPRYVHTEPSVRCHLIGFSDASELGYAAAFYLKVGDTPDVYLLKAKTKLAPVKSITIPRLELCGALLLARLYSSLKWLQEKLIIESVTFFTDSLLVIGWINTPTYQLKTFIANRVGAILEMTAKESWRHVSTLENPADCASRGLEAPQLIHHPLWWTGPAWLSDNPSNWPSSSIDTEVELPELKVTLAATTTFSNIIDWFKRFSSLTTLVRSAAYAFRFINRVKSRCTLYSGPISTSEYQEALFKCLKLLQQHHFSNILENKPIRDKALLSLNAFVAPDGLIRVGGRLVNAPLSPETKHPILLPSKAQLTKLIVDFYHQQYYHPGPTLLTALLRGQYWILNARSLIRHRVFKCRRCYAARTRPIVPYMGNLPSSRFHEGRAFIHVGVDYAGPFYIRDSLRRKPTIVKCYLALFICMSTKAMHLETVTSLSTDAFLAALDRFVARRGLPAHVYTDCGTNFVGADRCLKDVFNLMNSDETQKSIIKQFAPRGVQWSFNPPSAPHFGGLWEAGVKSVKSLLRKVLKDDPFTYEELSTIFCRIESILNSRPLCPLSDFPDNFDFLTPAHFLIGTSLQEIPKPSLLDVKEGRLSRWQIIQARVQQCWQRWRSEYLHTLQQRHKWLHKSKNLKVGDLVLLSDTSSIPGYWPMARVIETHPGNDGIIRVVTLKTSSGSQVKRPVAKIVSLQPLLEEEPSP